VTRCGKGRERERERDCRENFKRKTRCWLGMMMMMDVESIHTIAAANRGNTSMLFKWAPRARTRCFQVSAGSLDLQASRLVRGLFFGDGRDIGQFGCLFDGFDRLGDLLLARGT
jgi:hypothetical protein